MHDSGGEDTCGWGMLITSAVAILFSCFDWDTHALSPSPLDGLTARWSHKKPAFTPVSLAIFSDQSFLLATHHYDAEG